MEPTDDEVEDSQSSWERHPFTQRSRMFFEKRAADAYNELLGKCAHSSDPAVAGAYGQYVALLHTERYFKHRAGRTP